MRSSTPWFAQLSRANGCRSPESAALKGLTGLLVTYASRRQASARPPRRARIEIRRRPRCIFSGQHRTRPWPPSSRCGGGPPARYQRGRRASAHAVPATGRAPAGGGGGGHGYPGQGPAGPAERRLQGRRRAGQSGGADLPHSPRRADHAQLSRHRTWGRRTALGRDRRRPHPIWHRRRPECIRRRGPDHPGLGQTQVRRAPVCEVQPAQHAGDLWAFATSPTRQVPTPTIGADARPADWHAQALRHLFNRMLGQLHHCLLYRCDFDEGTAFPSPAAG